MPDLPDPLFLSDRAAIVWRNDGDIPTVELWCGEGDCVVLASDEIGDLSSTPTDGDASVCEVVNGQDFMSMAAQLLRLRGCADDWWISPDGTTEYVRVGSWVLTVADRFATPVHMLFPSVADARSGLRGWVRAHEGVAG